jgi:hypothetical protein
MTKGDLVRVRLGSREFIGSVVDYRPDTLGGSHLQSWKQKGRWFVEKIQTPVRGEFLILFYEDGDISWIDEMRVQPVQCA